MLEQVSNAIKKNSVTKASRIPITGEKPYAVGGTVESLFIEEEKKLQDCKFIFYSQNKLRSDPLLWQ